MSVVSVETFSDGFPAPTVDLLSKLSSGSIAQIDSLCAAMRYWVTLRSLYGDEQHRLLLPAKFGYADWFELAINQKKASPYAETPLHDVTLQQWLESGGINPLEWEKEYSACFSLSKRDQKKVLTAYIFHQPSNKKNEILDFIDQKDENDTNYTQGIVLKCIPFQNDVPKDSYIRRLRNDFTHLCNSKYINKESESKGNNSKTKNKYSILKVKNLPKFLTNSLLSRNYDLSLGGALHIGSLTVSLSDFAVNFKEPIADVLRFYMDLEYVIPQQINNLVSERQEQLCDLWEKPNFAPIQINYYSASYKQEYKGLVVYPVCIYYSQRACYLCAFGDSPDDQSGWYNYRLDKIESINELTWDSPNIPDVLKQKNKSGKLPVPEEIDKKFSEAWGFDHYLPVEMLTLRFPRIFNDLYIKDTERHTQFKPISFEQVLSMVKLGRLSSTDSEALLKQLANYPNDAYYRVPYRATDNKIIMRLRAWGPNVEVLLPWSLRQRMTDDIQATSSLYQ
jgi:CRISPR-associated protein (TIGR03985 family)